MNIKRFWPRQAIRVPAELGTRLADSFAVGEQHCVGVERLANGDVRVILDAQVPSLCPKLAHLELVYNSVGVVVSEVANEQYLYRPPGTTRETELAHREHRVTQPGSKKGPKP